jgi:hypothetical protein
MKQKWLSEIESQTDGVSYGVLEHKVTRVNRHTTKVTSTTTETLRYTDSGQALVDIVTFLEGLIDSKHTGTVQFEVAIKDGDINLLAIKNTRETKY